MSESILKISEVDYNVNSAKVGDIYKQHQAWLTSWLGRKIGCPHDAADLSHDAFLRLLSSIGLEDLRQPRAYLLVIANRLMINRYRRRKVEEEVLKQVSILIEQQENRCPAEIMAARELLAQVVFLLTEELAEKPRRAFFMARIEGASYREIAIDLGVSESSVKQYLAKAMTHCHARLYEH